MKNIFSSAIIFSLIISSSLKTILRPSGTLSDTKDPFIKLDLLNTWAHRLHTSQKPMIFAGIGKPTFTLNKDIAHYAQEYWQGYARAITSLEETLATKHEFTPEERCATIVASATAINYGEVAGEQPARTIMSQALTSWYKTDIQPESIIFTVGGIGALNMIVKVFEPEMRQGNVIIITPYYPFYSRPELQDSIVGIDCLKEPGYCLTADALQKAINRCPKKIKAFLFCDPNNPLGTTVGAQEWKKIATILQATDRQIPIIIDEAYAEMVFGEQHVSLLTIAPELKERIIVMRSATKALSASGERMAVIICHNQAWREKLSDQVVLACLHAPKSLQYTYAQAMLNFTPEKLQELCGHYELQTKYAQERLTQMNALLPDATYKPSGTFYVLANLSAILGQKLSDKTRVIVGEKESIETDEDICYSLLCDDQIMIAPLSYFGSDPKDGYVRITCSGGITELKELFDRIECRLNQKQKRS